MYALGMTLDSLLFGVDRDIEPDVRTRARKRNFLTARSS